MRAQSKGVVPKPVCDPFDAAIQMAGKSHQVVFNDMVTGIKIMFDEASPCSAIRKIAMQESHCHGAFANRRCTTFYRSIAGREHPRYICLQIIIRLSV